MTQSEQLGSTNGWSETDHANALRHLETLQEQIDKLRSTIPSLVHHFTPPPTSTITPAQLYQDFSKAATQACQDVKKLREDWHSEKSQNILNHTHEADGTYDDLDWEFIATARYCPLEGIEPETQTK